MNKNDIFEASIAEDEALTAEIHCITPPNDEQLEKIREFIMKKYSVSDVKFIIKLDTALVGGFNIFVGDDNYDWSTLGRIRQLRKSLQGLTKEYDRDGIISLLRENIENFELDAGHQQVGIVKTVADGIAFIEGLHDVEYGEIVLFDCGVKGMVQDIRNDGTTGIVLFGDNSEITAGSRVLRTQRTAGIPISNKILGRMIDPLGKPIDGKGEIGAKRYYPIERTAPAIMDRKPVSRPMQTGILAIDSMFPIGRGQRELIIGDRQTGKTSIAIDTILNQKDKNVVCVYVAIGQKASSVAQIVQNLKSRGAMEYTIIVNASASDSAPLQYIAPYAGCALGEYFMDKGKDVLIVYDDLSKHAIAYRSLSLLLERAPGREAYPGDVFYLHSRLLERSAHLSDEKGGGSMTALPIVETQSGDVSAYIPTNIISITDGQIFLESDLFFAGQRPAVNVGLSVSRVGGDAQTKAMKKAAGAIRLDLAQYREMEVFTQFASDLDDATKAQLTYGQGLMQVLKQGQYKPYKHHEQVIILVVVLNHLLQNIAPGEVTATAANLLKHFAEKHSEIAENINGSGMLEDKCREEIIRIAKDFLQGR